MTREEAIEYLEGAKYDLPYKFEQALDMAIDALQFVEHFDLLKEYQSLQEVIRCKDCKNRHEDQCPMYFEEQIDIDEGDGYYDTEYIVHDYTQDDGYCNCGEKREL